MGETSVYITPRRLPDQVTLVHGPHDLLGRYFLIADQAARDLGVRLRLRADFEGLIEATGRDAGGWPARNPIYDPRHSNLRLDNAFWIEGIDHAGDTAIVHAARLYDWPDTTVEAELRSLRVFYEDPAPHLAAGEHVDIDETESTPVRGPAMWCGALWVRPDYRRRGLTRIIPRVTHAYAYTRWGTGHTWILVEQQTNAGGLPRANGPFRVHKPLLVSLAFHADLTAVLLGMSADAMLADLQGLVDQARTDSSRRIETPNTYISSPRRQGTRSRS
jgi:GNAT superfamily N-acetyltransferase